MHLTIDVERVGKKVEKLKGYFARGRERTGTPPPPRSSACFIRGDEVQTQSRLKIHGRKSPSRQQSIITTRAGYAGDIAPAGMSGQPRTAHVPSNQFPESEWRRGRKMNEENQKERAEALDKIRAILSRTFLSPNDTTTTLVPPNNSTSSEDGETTTTQKPKIDRQMLLANLRRNLRGIGRLFMRELRTALATSRDNFYIFGGQVRDSIRSLFSRASISTKNMIKLKMKKIIVLTLLLSLASSASIPVLQFEPHSLDALNPDPTEEAETLPTTTTPEIDCADCLTTTVTSEVNETTTYPSTSIPESTDPVSTTDADFTENYLDWTTEYSDLTETVSSTDQVSTTSAVDDSDVENIEMHDFEQNEINQRPVLPMAFIKVLKHC
ncbi:Hypothetical predicted protein [Cloeon dipterum]|uniref:Uncharacterized protein n=1 Tax=Cloeon dipterum TaxID=197152 RepID=A0A8S1CCI3_9INSE|nr:Hypothetical predicted protein [Cloeon dipterum]